MRYPSGRRRHVTGLAALGLVTLSACTTSSASGAQDIADTATTASIAVPSTTAAPTTAAVPTTAASTTVATPSTEPITTTVPTTTTTPEPLDVYDADCVIRAEREITFEDVALDTGLVDPVSLWLENDSIDIVPVGTPRRRVPVGRRERHRRATSSAAR